MLLTFAGDVRAAEADADARQTVFRLLSRQHLDQGILLWKEAIAAAPVPDCGCGAAVQSKIAGHWRHSVDAAFGKLDFLDAVVDTYLAKFTPVELARLDAFSMSVLGDAIFTAENPRRAKELSAKLGTLDRKAALRALDTAPERKRLLNELLQAAGGVEAQVDTMMSISLAITIGTVAVLPKSQPRPDIAEITAMLDASRPVYRKQLDSVALIYYDLTYKALSTAQLKQYVAQVRSPLGAKNQAVLNSAVKSVLTGRALDIGRRFTKAMIGVDL